MDSSKKMGSPNNYPIGRLAGNCPADINGPKYNVMGKPSNDEDHDGKIDEGVSQELSEDCNGSLLKGK